MTETTLEALRRQIREAEERFKRAAAEESKGMAAEQRGRKFSDPVPPPPPAESPGKASEKLRLPQESRHSHAIVEPSSDWSAYGQMTPGFLNEISYFIASSIRDVSEHIRTRDTLRVAQPSLTRILQSVDRVRSLIAAWAESAEFLMNPRCKCKYGDLIREALNARRAELKRWRIETTFEDATAVRKQRTFPTSLFQVILHVLQSCIEQLREGTGSFRLAIRAQSLGERLETTFLYEISGSLDAANLSEGGSSPYEFLRSKNIELRAAQRLLDTMGGTLVLENVSGTKRSIRMNLNLSAFAAASAHEEVKSQGSQ